MPFIGVYAKENDSNFIKNEIGKIGTKNNFEIININKKNLSNLKNIRFDALIIKDRLSDLLNTSNYIKKIIENANYLIVNNDIENEVDIEKIQDKIITYGFKSNADISVSSIKEEKIMICIQRKIQKSNNDLLEEQEINVKIGRHNINKLYNILALYTILMVYNEKF